MFVALGTTLALPAGTPLIRRGPAVAPLKRGGSALRCWKAMRVLVGEDKAKADLASLPAGLACYQHERRPLARQLV